MGNVENNCGCVELRGQAFFPRYQKPAASGVWSSAHETLEVDAGPAWTDSSGSESPSVSIRDRRGKSIDGSRGFAGLGRELCTDECTIRGASFARLNISAIHFSPRAKPVTVSRGKHEPRRPRASDGRHEIHRLGSGLCPLENASDLGRKTRRCVPGFQGECETLDDIHCVASRRLITCGTGSVIRPLGSVAPSWDCDCKHH